MIIIPVNNITSASASGYVSGCGPANVFSDNNRKKLKFNGNSGTINLSVTSGDAVMIFDSNFTSVEARIANQGVSGGWGGLNSWSWGSLNSWDWATQESQLSNGKFQDNVNDWSTSFYASIAWDAIGYANGGCMKLTATGAGASYALQGVTTLTAGADYMFVGYVKAGTSYDAYIRIYDVTNGADIVPELSITLANANWYRVTRTFTVPATCSTVAVYLGIDDSTNYLYWDEVSLNPMASMSFDTDEYGITRGYGTFGKTYSSFILQVDLECAEGASLEVGKIFVGDSLSISNPAYGFRYAPESTAMVIDRSSGEPYIYQRTNDERRGFAIQLTQERGASGDNSWDVIGQLRKAGRKLVGMHLAENASDTRYMICGRVGQLSQGYEYPDHDIFEFEIKE
jgi:hypothetical protein